MTYLRRFITAPLITTPRLVILVLTLICVSVGILLLVGLRDFDLSGRQVQTLSFQTDMGSLSGSLVLPAATPEPPIVLFVHGDGPQDRFASQAYLPLINALLDNGIGVYSWDKAGVGESQGDWLAQTMSDRADEALAALEAVRQATQTPDHRLGFIGFSQAGWVLPKIAQQAPSDIYFVIIGGATNWLEQGDYFARKRLEAAGHSDLEIQVYLEEQRALYSKIFTAPGDYQLYLQSTDESTPMTEARFHFVVNNYLADATTDLSAVRSPMLAVFGDQDLNVDAHKEAVIYERLLADSHPASQVHIWPDATHGLTKAGWFNQQLASQTPLRSQVYALFAGRHIFAPGVIDFISSWIQAQSR